jgi:DNA-binding response OmpR family regulator
VVDIGLPGADGLSLLRHLRRSGSLMPVLILTGRDEVRDRVDALELGADDYLTKPFAMAELLARCRALWRRSQQAATNVVGIGHLRLDLARRSATCGGQALALTRGEWQVLECLAARPGRLVAKDVLAAALAQGSEEATAHAVEACVSRLRAKLDGGAMITALRGFGYRLDEPG